MTFIMRAMMVRSRSESSARKFTAAADATHTVARRSPLRALFRTSSTCAVVATGATVFFTAKGVWAAFEDTLHGCSETQWYSFFAGCVFDTAMQPVIRIQHAIQTFMEQPCTEPPNWNDQIRHRARNLLLTDAATHEQLSPAAVQSRAWELEKIEKESMIAALEADLRYRSEVNARQMEDIAGLRESAHTAEGNREEDARKLALHSSEVFSRLEEENVAHVQKIAKLEQVCDECRAAVARKTDEINRLDLETQALSEKISRLEQALASSDEGLMRSLEELRLSQSNKAQETKRLEGLTQNHSEEIKRLEALSSTQTEEIDRLQGLSHSQSEEVERLQGLSHNQSEDMKQLSELNRKLEQQSLQFQVRIDKLEVAEASAKEREEELRSMLKQAAAKSNRLRDELDATCNKLDSEALQSKALAKSVAEKEAEISTAHQREDDLKAAHAADLAKIAADRKAHEEEIRLQHEQQLVSSKKQQDEMQATLAKELDEQRARSATREKELQSDLLACVAEAKSREEITVVEHAAKIGELESIANRNEEELRSHAQKLEQAELHAQNREAELRRKFELQSAESKQLLSKLTSELEAAESSARSREEHINKQLQQATSRSEQLSDELAAIRSKLTSEVQHFKEKLEAASNHTRKLEADLASVADARQKDVSTIADLKAAHAATLKDLEQERKASQAEAEERTLLRWEKKADARVISNLSRSNHKMVTSSAEQAEEIKLLAQNRQEQREEITRLKQMIETNVQEIAAIKKSHVELEASSKKVKFW